MNLEIVTPFENVPFIKVHGAGNDFVLIPDLEDNVVLDKVTVQKLCNRHFGVGADGVIRVGPPRPGVTADAFMDYYNADGTVAEMCGNGVRTVAKYLADRSPTLTTVSIDTRAEVKTVTFDRGTDGLVHECTVNMGVPTVDDRTGTANLAGTTLNEVPPYTAVSMGNPHAVIITDDVAIAPIELWAEALNRLEKFPDGVNVEAIQITDDHQLTGRIIERGVGETLASGTGGSAMAVAAITSGRCTSPVTVHLPGGTLTVEWSGEGAQLSITGSAVEVFNGTIAVPVQNKETL